MNLRKLTEADFHSIHPRLDEWWGGRLMSAMLPRLFFVHFSHTSFVIEKNKGEIAAFLVGFFSPSVPEEAYIHFVGVHPEYRKQGLGRRLYRRFFEKARQHERRTIRCVTSPVNRTSIVYHRQMGFQIVEGDCQQDGISIHTDYDGPGNDRVLFIKGLEQD
ncbi:GNAT family N-acetyltransferase [Desmospora activa]|uniref:Ribosomal protein S18 acetylase RimI-like enzyme n=1 Tax=Desmospora activa DSM 45169 TaxID=1121389 RepID=A0A2T4Z6K6_9BACL|nr:GNAT family N-acetyltransferase [Desmospora activa]PTM57516.1 ribosomal protein S18 acetylase RimI-like enzyme [Desmospora activa DSM 45169]